MAELVGVVAGGAGLASLALQLGECALKLREVHKSYKNVPQFLEQTAHEIETIVLILSRLQPEDEAGASKHDDILTRCVNDCQETVARFRITVDKLESAMKKSKSRGRLKTVIEEKGLSTLSQDLERAKSSLLLTVNIYTEYPALNLLNPTDLTLRRAQRQADNQRSQALLHATRRVAEEQMRALQSQSRMLQEQNAAIAIQRLALQQLTHDVGILPQKVAIVAPSLGLDFKASWYSKWPAKSNEELHENVFVKGRIHDKFHLKGLFRYFVLPQCSKDSMIRLKQCFVCRPPFSSTEVRVAFIHTPRGWHLIVNAVRLTPDTGLLQACDSGDTQALLALIAEGNYPDPMSFYDEHGNSPLMRAYAHGNVEVCRILLNSCSSEYEMDRVPLLDSFCYFEDPNIYLRMYEAFDTIIDRSALHAWVGCQLPLWWTHCPTMQVMRFLIDGEGYYELSFAQRFNNAMQLISPHVSPAMFLHGLRDGEMEELALLVDHDGRTILHYIASQPNRLGNECLWTALFLDLLRSGADLHAEDNIGRCPLTIYMTGCKPTELCNRIRRWAGRLQEAKVNLLEYGRKESKSWRLSMPDLEVVGDFEVFELEYGATPEEWDLGLRKKGGV